MPLTIRHQIIVALSLLVPLLCAADISPQRLALLRGTILLDEGNPDALADLRQAVQYTREDWRSQLLYGDALALTGQPIMARAQYRRAALLAPWRPEPWQAIARLGRAQRDATLEYAGLAGVLRIFPNDPTAHYRMAFLCRLIGRTAEADREIGNWQATLPPLQFPTGYPDADHPASLEALRTLAVGEAPDPALLLSLAGAEWQAGHGEAARTVLTRLLALAPNDRTVQRNLVHVTLELGHVEEALVLLRSLPGDDDILPRAQAAWSLSVGRYADAIAPLRTLVERTPLDGLLRYQLGVACFLAGEVAVAIPELQSAWALRPDDRIAQMYAGALLTAGRATEAEKLLLDARQRFPQETILVPILVNAYQAEQRLSWAADFTARLATQRPETVELLILAGERYLAANDPSQARIVARRLRDLYPGDIVAVHGAIGLYRQLDATADASITLTRYLGPNIASPFARSELLCEVARYAIEDHSLDEAEAALEESIRVDPDYRPAYLLLGKVYQQQEAWVNAQGCYRDGHARWPTDATLTLALARAAWKSGDLLEAIDAYRAATGLLDDAGPWLELGAIYLQLGDVDRACECWHTAASSPAGLVHARLNLLVYDEHVLPDAEGKAALTHLLSLLADARAARARHWRAALTARGLTATDDEIEQLLLLDGDLADPAPLRARRDAGFSA